MFPNLISYTFRIGAEEVMTKKNKDSKRVISHLPNPLITISKVSGGLTITIYSLRTES